MKKRNLKAILFALSLGIFGMTGCGSSIDTDDIGAPFEAMLNDLADTTLLDEVLQSGGEYSHLVADFTKLEQYLVSASKLNNLDFDDKTNKEKIKCNTVLSTTDINQMISDIELLDANSNEYKKALGILKYNEGILNQWISENGYRIVHQMGVLVARTKLVEACNLDANQYNHFSIYDDLGNFMSNTGVKYSANDIENTYRIVKSTVEGQSNELLFDLINDSYDNKKCYENKKKTTNQYDDSLCDSLQDSIVLIKKNMCSKSIQNDNTIYPVEATTQVEAKYDKVLKKHQK